MVENQADAPENPAPKDPTRPLHLASRIAAGILLVELGVLTITGVWLTFFYRPAFSQTWPGVTGHRDSLELMRSVHIWTSRLAIPTAMAFAASFIAEVFVRASRPWPRLRATVASVALVPGVLLASFTGALLPWDQVALWAVSVGKDIKGYQFLWDSSGDYRFVLVGGSEIGIDTLLRWLIVHAVVLPALMLMAIAVAWRATRKRPKPVQ